MMNTIRNTLATTLSSGVTTGGTTYALGSIGINVDSTGAMSVDTAALTTALKSNSSAVTAIFNQTNGIARRSMRTSTRTRKRPA